MRGYLFDIPNCCWDISKICIFAILNFLIRKSSVVVIVNVILPVDQAGDPLQLGVVGVADQFRILAEIFALLEVAGLLKRLVKFTNITGSRELYRAATPPATARERSFRRLMPTVTFHVTELLK